MQAYCKYSKPIFPIGLARIASVVKQKHEIEIFDPNLEGEIVNTLRRKLIAFGPDVVGVSLRNIDSVDYIGNKFYYPEFVRLVEYVRSCSPDTKIVVGGGGFSLYASEIMQSNSDIDIGVYLEAEESFPELIDNFDNPQTVKGLFLREREEVRFTGRRNLVDFWNCPDPAYEFFDLKKYGVSIGIEGKRGCCLRCAYCPYTFLNGRSLRVRTPQAIVDEIEFLVTIYGIKEFSFTDSVFNIPIEHSNAIMKEIISRGLKVRYSCWTNEKIFSEEYARLAIAAGCVDFPFSTDAFSNHSLRLLNKNYTREDILNTVEVAKKIDGIKVGYGFFLNPPGTSLRSILQTIRFLVKTKFVLGKKLKGGILFIFNRIRIEPHTRIREIAISEGLITAETSLLRPIYYSQPSTRYIETLYNIITLPIAVMAIIARVFLYGLKKF